MPPWRPFLALFVFFSFLEVPSQAVRSSTLDARRHVSTQPLFRLHNNSEEHGHEHEHNEPGHADHEHGHENAEHDHEERVHAGWRPQSPPSEEHGHEHAEHKHEELEHGEHSDEHGGHHHGPPPKEAMFLSYMLMGAVPFILVLFYLVKSSDEDIRWSSWRTLNMTLSIFLSVLLCWILRALFMDVLTLAGVDTMDHTVMAGLCFTIFLILYPLQQLTLFQLRHAADPRTVHAVGLLFSQVNGFNVMFSFAALMDTPFFASSSYMSLAVLVLSIVTVGGISVVAVKARESMATAGDGELDDATKEKEKVWVRVAEQAEDDVMSLCFSFILTAVVRTLIRGPKQPYLAQVEPAGIPQWQCWTLLAFAFGFNALALASAKVSTYLGPFWQRRAKINSTTLAMASSWCTLFWADWQLYTLGYEEVRVSACLLVAFVLTFAVILEMFLVDFVADRLQAGRRTLRLFIAHEGLLIGFAWARTFDIAIQDVGHAGGVIGLNPTITTHIQAFVLLLVVLPAWFKYILPTALHARKQEEEKLSKA